MIPDDWIIGHWILLCLRSVLTNNTTHTYLCIMESIKRVAETERSATSLKNTIVIFNLSLALKVL